MLRTLSARHDRFALNAPFRISRGVKTAADVVTVTVAGAGHVGRGEGVPYPRYGETVEAALAAIEQARALIERGGSRADLAGAMPAGAARNAVDNALWDWEARAAGTSVSDRAGLPAVAPVASAITVAIDHPDAMAAVAASHADAPLLKVKVAREDALRQIAAVRAAAPTPRLIVDPNESWTIEEVRGWQDELIAQRVDLLEQPLPAGEDGALAALETSLAICADESLHTAADLGALRGRYTHVNIKLDKTGGLTEALSLAEAASAMGFGLMVGCMVCSSLGIAPALLLAQRAQFVDLDGPLWLAADRDGGAIDDHGILQPPRRGFWGEAA